MTDSRPRTVAMLGTLAFLASLGSAPAFADPPAEAFARVVMKAIRQIEEQHFAPPATADAVRWAVQGLYENVNQPVPKDLAARLKRLSKPEPAEVAGLLRDVHLRLRRHAVFGDEQALEVCTRAIFDRLEFGANPPDRSSYTRGDNLIRCGDLTRNSSGIGLLLIKDHATGLLRVRTPLRKSPAYDAGLRAGDLIAYICLPEDRDGNILTEPLFVTTRGMSVERASELFIGRDGSLLTLGVIPARRR